MWLGPGQEGQASRGRRERQCAVSLWWQDFTEGEGEGWVLSKGGKLCGFPLQGLPPVLGGAQTAGLGSWTAREEAKSNQRLPSNAGESRSWLWRWEKWSGWDSVVRGDSVRFEK